MNTKSEPKISVIIPTYNRAASIGKSISSVIDQTWQNFEIIVVDDGSTDNTRQIVESFMDERIRYIYMEKNGGASHARNEGIRQAKYDFIAFLDSDDEWVSEKLEKQMEVMLQASDQVGLVYCRMRRNRENGDSNICPPLEMKKEILEGNIFRNLLGDNVIGTPTILVRKECLEQTGGFDEGLKCLEDWELILRIAEKWEIGFADDILVEMHFSQGGVSDNSKGFVETRCFMIAKYWEIMAQRGILKPVVEEVLTIANQCGYYEEAKQLLSAALQF